MGKSIIALATPPLKGALSVIRATGDDIFAITDSLFTQKVSGIQKREIFVGYLKTPEGKKIDQVVILAYPAPKTMTGEDVIEIMPHGSMLIVNEIIASYQAKGAIYAARGEFTSRAFYNGKMDLIEAEAVNDLINATTQEAKDLALLSLKGEASQLIAPIKKAIADILSLIEVGIDFPEYEDIQAASEEKIVKACGEIIGQIQTLIDGAEEGKIIKEGINVALVGQPNVGKSSILNALLEQEKAIVSPIPGTTRDVVEGDISIHGVPLHLLDTAGIHQSGDAIENLGIKKSQESLESADLVIVILDSSKKALDEEDQKILAFAKNKKHILCYNKADLIQDKEDGKLYVSATKHDIKALKEAIFASLSLSENSFHKPSLSSAREIGLLKKIEADLSQASMDAKAGLGMDLISVNLQSAYREAQEILGEYSDGNLEDEIFSRFCVGK